MRFWQPSRPVLQTLAALSALRHRLIGVRRQLEQPLAEQQNFGEPGLYKQLTKTCRASIAAIKADLETVEKQIQTIINQDDRLKQLFDCLISVQLNQQYTDTLSRLSSKIHNLTSL